VGLLTDSIVLGTRIGNRVESQFTFVQGEVEKMCSRRLQTSTVAAIAPFAVSLVLWSAEGRADELKTGDRAPDFAATGLDGKPLKLSSFQGNDGKNVVLVFNRGHW